jgi:membrane carboxypeptidase/penicillin-binding protein
MTDMMRDVLRPGGTGSSLGPLLNRPAAAKTGTSEDHRDAYIVGYTPDLVTAIWIGNDDNSSLGWGQTGSRLAGPVWVNFMREALKNTAPRDFERPAGIVSALICPETGLLHNPQCSLTPINELFIAGTEPTEMCRWPLCPHCHPEQQWHWNGGWFRRSQ